MEMLKVRDYFHLIETISIILVTGSTFSVQQHINKYLLFRRSWTDDGEKTNLKTWFPSLVNYYILGDCLQIIKSLSLVLSAWNLSGLGWGGPSSSAPLCLEPSSACIMLMLNAQKAKYPCIQPSRPASVAGFYFSLCPPYMGPRNLPTGRKCILETTQKELAC